MDHSSPPSSVSTFAITPATSEDYPHLVEVWEASVRATHLHFVKESDIDIFKPFVIDTLPKIQLICAREDERGEAMGFLGMEENGNNVEMLFVHPQWHGKGVGTQLLTHAIVIKKATLVDVNEQNSQAVKFYKRMGFEVVGRSERDGMGKPYPLLHMQLANTRSLSP